MSLGFAHFVGGYSKSLGMMGTGAILGSAPAEFDNPIPDSLSNDAKNGLGGGLQGDNIGGNPPDTGGTPGDELGNPGLFGGQQPGSIGGGSLGGFDDPGTPLPGSGNSAWDDIDPGGGSVGSNPLDIGGMFGGGSGGGGGLLGGLGGMFNASGSASADLGVGAGNTSGIGGGGSIFGGIAGAIGNTGAPGGSLLGGPSSALFGGGGSAGSAAGAEAEGGWLGFFNAIFVRAAVVTVGALCIAGGLFMLKPTQEIIAGAARSIPE